MPNSKVKRYVFGAVYIPQKGLWLMEGTYPGLVVEALTLPVLLEKAAWAIRAIEKAESEKVLTEIRAN